MLLVEMDGTHESLACTFSNSSSVPNSYQSVPLDQVMHLGILPPIATEAGLAPLLNDAISTTELTTDPPSVGI